MSETDLYAPIVAGLMSEGNLVFKIADGSVGKKPFDICGITNDGRGLCVEVKITSRDLEDKGPDWSFFRSHQVTWLRAYAKSGAIALAAIYSEKTHKLSIWKLEKASDRCIRAADLVLIRNQEANFSGWQKVTSNGRDS